MDGSTGPPSDVTTMASENEEQSKTQRDTEDMAGSSASSGTATTGSTYSATQPEQPAMEYRGQGLRRTDSNPASPLPAATAHAAATSSSSSSSFSSSSSSLSSSSFASTPPPQPGCGYVAATVLEPDEITISITPTTGGQFDLTVDRTETVENLKKIISKRLKVAKERICLLQRERQLHEGTLEENRLQDGSRLTLLPCVETGLLAQRPEQSVMQALESLNDSQVNDFLSGKAPLNLTMRLGDHMMLIQLQLSTVTPASPTTNQTTNNTSGLTIGGNSSNGSNLPTSHVSTSLQSRRSAVLAARSTSNASASKLQSGATAARRPSLLSRLTSALCAAGIYSTSLSTATTTISRATTASSVSSSSSSSSSSTSSSSSSSPSPSSSSSYSPISPPHSSFSTTGQTPSPRTASNHGSVPHNGNSNTYQWLPGLLYPLYHHHPHSHHHHHRHHHHHHHHSRNKPSGSSNNTQSTSASSPSPSPAASSSSSVDHLQQSTSTGHGSAESIPYDLTLSRKKLCPFHSLQSANNPDSTRSSNTVDVDATPQNPTTSSSSTSWSSSPVIMPDIDPGTIRAIAEDTKRALLEATRNLTQKLKQLSSEENARRRQGAIIESMHHHGKGVYSGTFSGTLNPALQDRHGRPKRDISTIIHILNDLLCATPAATASHYRHHHRHSSGRQQSSNSPSSTGMTTMVNGASTPIGCHDTSNPGYSTEELSKENEATKGKMRRLRLVMEQRRARRKARRQGAAPYTTRQWAAVTPDPDPNHDPNTSTAATTNAAEPQNEPELQPCSPEPVVA